MTTTTRKRVTKREAERVLAAVKRAFPAWLGKGSVPPKLVKDWNWGFAWAIVWEEGPYDWAVLFPHGGIDEEFGGKHPDVSDRLPEGVWTEAATSWAIAIYPKDW